MYTPYGFPAYKTKAKKKFSVCVTISENLADGMPNPFLLKKEKRVKVMRMTCCLTIIPK